MSMNVVPKPEIKSEEITAKTRKLKGTWYFSPQGIPDIDYERILGVHLMGRTPSVPAPEESIWEEVW